MMMKSNTNISDVIEQLLNSARILITPHFNIDGDGFGSSLALYIALFNIGKKVDLILTEPVSKMFTFLNFSEKIKRVNDIDNLGHYDTFVVLDSSNKERLGDLKNFKNYDCMINIDHHISNSYFADMNYVNDVSSTGENIYEIIKKISIIDKDIANALLMSIYSDTAGLRYTSTSTETVKIVSDLISLGAKPAIISNALFYNISVNQMLLKKKIMDTLIIDEKNHFAYIILRKKDLEKTQTTMEDTEGLIDIPRSIQGINIAFFAKEINENKFKFSFRSNSDSFDVNEFCGQYGGGGHKRAAGCTIDGNINNIILDLSDKLKDIF